MLKNLKFEQVVLFLLVGYIIFNRLVEQSGSQALLKETEQKAKNAEALSQQAIMRTKAIEDMNNQMTIVINDLQTVNQSAIEEIQELNKKYKARKDSTLNGRLNRVKQNLLELQKLQNQLWNPSQNYHDQERNGTIQLTSTIFF